MTAALKGGEGWGGVAGAVEGVVGRGGWGARGMLCRALKGPEGAYGVCGRGGGGLRGLTRNLAHGCGVRFGLRTSRVYVAAALAAPQSGLTPQQMVAQEFALVYQPYNIAAVNMIQVRGCGADAAQRRGAGAALQRCGDEALRWAAARRPARAPAWPAVRTGCAETTVPQLPSSLASDYVCSMCWNVSERNTCCPQRLASPPPGHHWPGAAGGRVPQGGFRAPAEQGLLPVFRSKGLHEKRTRMSWPARNATTAVNQYAGPVDTALQLLPSLPCLPGHPPEPPATICKCNVFCRLSNPWRTTWTWPSCASSCARRCP